VGVNSTKINPVTVVFMSIVIRSDFVVYGYARERADRFGNEGTYYYIGKGTPKRPYSCQNRTIKCPRDREKNIHIVHSGLEEKEAFRLEVELIAKYGRKDLYPEWGVLYNKTNGGEGASGAKYSEDIIKKRSGKNHPKYRSDNWCHIEYGFVGDISPCDLVKKFSEEVYVVSGFSKVLQGRGKRYRGWVHIPLIEVQNLSDNKLPQEVFTTEYAKSRIDEIQKEYIKNCRKANSKKGRKGELSPHYGKKGEDHPSYGKKRSKESRETITRAFRMRKSSVRIDWIHPVHGKVMGVLICELVEMFPDEKLKHSCLSNVRLKKSKHHKDWRLLESNG
jgi:hypothetical protein